jgi:hypothetical protein
VIVVLAERGEAGVAAVLVAGIVVPVIPAPRPLTQVAANRAHVANLRRADLASGHRQQRRLLLDDGAFRDLDQQRRGADAKTGGGGADPLQLLEPTDRHQAFGRGEIVFHLAEEVRAAGEEHDLAVLLCLDELRGCFPESGGPTVAEVVHRAPLTPCGPLPAVRSARAESSRA